MKKKIMETLLTEDVIGGCVFVTIIWSLSALVAVSYQLGKKCA